MVLRIWASTLESWLCGPGIIPDDYILEKKIDRSGLFGETNLPGKKQLLKISKPGKMKTKGKLFITSE